MFFTNGSIRVVCILEFLKSNSGFYPNYIKVRNTSWTKKRMHIFMCEDHLLDFKYGRSEFFGEVCEYNLP